MSKMNIYSLGANFLNCWRKRWHVLTIEAVTPWALVIPTTIRSTIHYETDLSSKSP